MKLLFSFFVVLTVIMLGLLVRREWERHTDDPDTGASVETTWHLRTAITLGALAVVSALSILVSQLG